MENNKESTKKVRRGLEEQPTEEEIQTFLSKTKNKGLAGLNNLGNTCFMNSALQCLSNCPDLTYYFLSKKALTEINTTSKYGTGGMIAGAFFGLLNDLWNNKCRAANPKDLKSKVGKKVPKFRGFAQQDSQEFIVYLLDLLNEDLCRSDEKKYFELDPKGTEETEKEAADRFWYAHVHRNNSAITDLVGGQYRTTITCPDCHYSSITFNPFNTLSLPVPDIIQLNVFVIRACSAQTVQKIVCTAPKGISVGEIVQGGLKREPSEFKAAFVSGNRLVGQANEDETVELDKSKYFFLYEATKQSVFFEVVDSNEEHCGLPRVIDFSKGIKEIKQNVYRFARKFFTFSMDSPLSEASKFEELICDPEIQKNAGSSVFFQELDKEYEIFLKNKETLPYSLYFISETGEKHYLIGGTKQICFDEALDLKERYRLTFKFEDEEFFDRMRETIKPAKIGSFESKLTLEHCLNKFKAREVLEKGEEWYCSKCKDHKLASIKSDIYYAPKVLIVQLKRFRGGRSMGLGDIFSRKRGASSKNDATVLFSTESVDFSKHIAGEYSNSKKYALTGVSQHYGSLGGGHYTAACKNGNSWYKYNDSSCSKVSSSEACSNAAYILFFRRIDN